MRIFDDQQSIVLEKALDASFLRQETINNNLANVDTPGFKRTEISFENQLRRFMSGEATASNSLLLTRTHTKHLQIPHSEPGYDPQTTVLEDWVQRNSENNVDIDVEMAKQAKNSMYYDSVATGLNFRFRSLATVITEGRR